MNTIFVLLIALALAFFLPQYKFSPLKSICAKACDIVIRLVNRNATIEAKNRLFNSLILFFLLCLTSFIIPSIIFYYISKLSNILLFIIEVVMAYHLITILDVKHIFEKQTNNDVTQNSTTIIQSVIMFVDDFFIPCFCIALLGLPCALLYRTFSYCTKKVLSFQNEHLRIIEKVHNILYFIPSYVIVLTILVASIFFPFCNTKNAYEIVLLQRKSIKPFWLSRILAACFGSICIEVPMSFLENGTIITQNIGNVRSTINDDDVKSIHYILYCSGIIVLSFTLVFRLILTWGVW